MANLLSSKKRNKQNERNRTRNVARKSRVKTETKKLLGAIQQGDAAGAEEQYKTVVKRLDQSAAKGTMHRRTAARKKSRLAKRVNAAKAAKKS